MQRYNITAVSYLNTKPFIYGLEQSKLIEQISLSQDFPAICAEKLISGEADIALVPVAVIPQLEHPHIISDYCIGADGPVKTVCLFSEVPIDRISTIYLDYQSRTSVRLLEVLCREYWKVKPKMVKAHPGYMSEIKGTVAGVVIGDRAIGFLEQYPYVYDLSVGWQALTGMPFVFAAWVARQALPDAFVSSFNSALSLGLDLRSEIADRYQYLNNQHFNTNEYLHRNIDYYLDERKKEAMQLFLEKLTALEGEPMPELHFSMDEK